MLKITLRDLIASRFHCKIEVETADVLHKMALLSPAAASYLLFGETTLYEKSAEHAQTLGKEQVAFANEIMKQNILHQVLLRYSDDSTNANLLDTLEGEFIALQLITVRVAAAYKDRLAFNVLSVRPTMSVRASEDIEMGQMVSGPPSLFVQTGTTLMHMGEFDLAVKEFDKVLSIEISPDIRAAAMNNKGLILLDPKLSGPRKNLEMAESMLDNNGQTPDRI
jgi:tetratricopeptide (TPR) repeat protein